MARSKRGGLVTFVSRCGPVVRQSCDNSVSFEESNVAFDLTPQGRKRLRG